MKKILILFSILFLCIAQARASCGDLNVWLTYPESDCCPSPGESVYFNFTVDNPDGCNITHLVTDFGDGSADLTSLITQNPFFHIYTTTGTFLVKVKSLDNLGQTIGYFEITVRIYSPQQCNGCAVIDIDYNNIDCPVTNTFFTSHVAMSRCDATNISYVWVFGDQNATIYNSNTSTLQNPSHYYSAAGTYICTLTVTITFPGGTCTQTTTIQVNPAPPTSPYIPLPDIVISPINPTVGTPITFTSVPALNVMANINFGDGTSAVWNLTQPLTHNYTQSNGTGFYNITVIILGECEPTILTSIKFTATPVELPCKDCIGSFNPEPGKKYLISAWVSEAGAPPVKTQLTFPSIALQFNVTGGGTVTLPDFYPKDEIIDGWERIEEEFTVPVNADHLNIIMKCSTGDCYFDDIRIFPFDGTMKSFVYDPLNLRLAAELDERNYATLYEYDEEGKLIRVKKETERGKMTIQENRNNTSKN